MFDQSLPTSFHSFRHYIGIFREEALLGRLSNILETVKTHGFNIKSLEAHHKDGGVFVKFAYDPGASQDAALSTILQELRNNVTSHGGVPSWTGFPTGNVWLVKGRPWREVGIDTIHALVLQWLTWFRIWPIMHLR